NGQCVQCTLAAHCATPTNQCQSATCTGTPPRCVNVNRAARQPCTGGVCNGSGSCVECVSALDCPVQKKICGSANRCVQCQVAGDCAQGYECRLSDNTCQRVSIAGMTAGCSSYGTATGGKCAGYYCNVTSSLLSSAFDPTAVCGNIGAAALCSGDLGRDAATCSRQQKSANPLDTNAQLRPKIEACIRARANYTNVSAQCMGCYLNVEECANATCLVECLGGNSASCDTCRRNSNCDQQLPGCGGLPNPF
ncbi:MAG TPA: hypothetical protein VFZ61_22850, partial [Polyangiales bacterium]